MERGCDTQKWIWPPLNCPPLALQGVTSVTRLSLLMSRDVCDGMSACQILVWILSCTNVFFCRATRFFSPLGGEHRADSEPSAMTGQ